MRITVSSNDSTDSPADIEDKLVKAAESVQLQREHKQFRDLYLLDRKSRAEEVTRMVLDQMMFDIGKIISRGRSKNA